MSLRQQNPRYTESHTRYQRYEKEEEAYENLKTRGFKTSPLNQLRATKTSVAKDAFLDLEIIYKVMLNDSDTGLMTYRLTKALVDSLHLDMDYLRNCAILNNADKVECQSLAEIFGIPDTMTDMYVISPHLSHQVSTHGAEA